VDEETHNGAPVVVLIGFDVQQVSWTQVRVDDITNLKLGIRLLKILMLQSSVPQQPEPQNTSACGDWRRTSNGT
jgi:hypothetical protein